MKIERVWAVFFSPAKSTEKITVTAAASAAKEAGLEEIHFLDMTRPVSRMGEAIFGPGDLVVMGTPTYAGRVPNKIMPFIKEKIHGKGAFGAAVVTYGNRSFDDSLMELSLLMKENGFTLLGGGAFVCRHAFAETLAPGRPDASDLDKARRLGALLAEKAAAGDLSAPELPGNNPVGPYYVPKGTDGQPAVFLKAKPVTDRSRCTGCGLCEERCPMGSIKAQDNFEVTGICIKCQACIVSCPARAKYFADEAFLSHKAMLQENFAEVEKVSEIYVSKKE